MAARKKAATRKVIVPTLRNVAELRATPRKPTLLHFSEEQWKQAIKGAKTIKALKKGQPYLEYTPIPDGGGIVTGNCAPQSADEVCALRPVLEPPGTLPGPKPGPGPGPDPWSRGKLARFRDRWPIRYECQCRTRGGRRLPPRTRPVCELVVDRLGNVTRIRCSNNRCGGTCALRLIFGQGRRVQLTCLCT